MITRRDNINENDKDKSRDVAAAIAIEVAFLQFLSPFGSFKSDFFYFHI